MIMHSEVLTSDCNDQSHKLVMLKFTDSVLFSNYASSLESLNHFKIFMSVANIVPKQTRGFDCGHVANNNHALPRSSPNTDPNQQS